MDLDPGSASASRARLLADALGFLGHDVREGHTSILALIELQRLRHWPAGASELGPSLETVSRRALAAVDDFLQFAAIVERAPVSVPVDWAAAWHEAWADAWPEADRRGVRLISAPGAPESLPGHADRELLGVLLRRVIGMAIERSPSGSDLTGTLRRAGGGVVIELHGVLSNAAPTPRPEARRSALGPRIVAAAAERLHAAVRSDESSFAGTARVTLSAPLASA